VKYPLSLRYSKSHHWINLNGGYAVVGITRHAQASLGQIERLELPSLGLEVRENELVGTVCGTEGVFEVRSPIQGRIVEVHSNLSHRLHLINTHPHSEGWLIQMEVRQTSCVKTLMNATDYRRFLQMLIAGQFTA
jgi:glycine cleavage system H protein